MESKIGLEEMLVQCGKITVLYHCILLLPCISLALLKLNIVDVCFTYLKFYRTTWVLVSI